MVGEYVWLPDRSGLELGDACFEGGKGMRDCKTMAGKYERGGSQAATAFLTPRRPANFTIRCQGMPLNKGPWRRSFAWK